MLSLQAFRTGSLQHLVRISNAERVAVVLQCRTSSSAPAPAAGKAPAAPGGIAKEVEDWKRAKQLFAGPERDNVNFPAYEQARAPAKVKLGFLPDSWFEYYYQKGGVSGEYLLLWGGFATLLSKQIWVMDHTFTEAICAALALKWLHGKFGAKMAKFFDKITENNTNASMIEPLNKKKQVAVDKKKAAELDIWRLEGLPMLYQLKRENIDLQLEANYRKRMNEVHKTVKQQLDYHVDVALAKRRIEQEHMVNWITDSVVKSLTPQLEKDSISSCLQNLKRLSTSTTL